MKLVLKIELIKTHILKMSLIYIDHDVLNSPKYNYGKNGKYDDITIWSFNKFIFDKRQIRLPEKDHIIYDMNHTAVFSSDKERYETLKKYYFALIKWSSDKTLFSNNKVKGNNIIEIQDKYWIVY